MNPSILPACYNHRQALQEFSSCFEKYIASESKLSSISELYILEEEMLTGSMVNTVGIGLSVRQFANLSGCTKGSEFASTIGGINFKLFTDSNTCKYKRRSGESRLLVWASAKAEEIEVEGKDKANLLRSAVDWKKAETYKGNGEIVEGKVDGSNSGGVLVRFHSLQGFLPYSQMSPSLLLKDRSKTISESAKDLIGSTLSLKVIEVSEEENMLIFSEKQAMWEKFSINVGDVFEGRVSSVTKFGAFVNLRFPDGGYYVDGLVHISEVSWDLVRDVRDILKKGDDVRVKVIQIDVEKSRLAFSIKQLQADPLFETLDTLMPQEDTLNLGTSTADGVVPSEPLPDLEQICKELLQEEGITDVKIGRQVLEKRVVSQDLELWLSNMPVEGGKFTLLARAGRQVQEVYLETSLERVGIKQAVQRVMGRVL